MPLLLQLQELTDAKHQLEATVRELTMKQSSLEAENERLQADLDSVRHEYSSLGLDFTRSTYYLVTVAVIATTMFTVLSS